MPRKKATTPQKPLLVRSPDGRGKAKAQEPAMANLKQEEEEEEEEAAIFSSPPPSSSSSPNAATSPSCFSLLNYSCTKPSPEKLPELHEQWRESQRATAAQISRQLKLKWALDSLIDSHLQNLRAHLTSAAAAGPSHLPRVLLPPWDPPLLTAAASWLGCTWRPSAVLSLVGPSVSGPLPPRTHRIIEEATRRFRIEEAVLEEEMAEYQALSVLGLRGPGTRRERRRRVWEEARKVAGVVERAGRLRYRAVEVAVRGAALEEAQAAQFIVALAGVEDAARRAAERWRARAGAVAVEVQAFD